MRKIRRIVGSSAALLVGAFCSDAAAQISVTAASPSATELDELAAGEVISQVTVHGRETWVEVLGVVDAEPAQVWRAVGDFANQSEWVPGMASSRVVGVDGDCVIGRGVTEVAIVSDRTWDIRICQSQREFDGVQSNIASWSYVPGSGNMNENTGYWLVQPFGDGTQTLVKYEVLADAGISAPDSIERPVAQRMMRQFISGLRRYLGAESN